MTINFEKLQAPIPARLVKTKTTNYVRDGKKKQFSVKHITARTVMNRLDTVVGPQNWRTEFSSEGLPPNTIRCTLFLRMDDGEWVGKSDIGTPTDVEPEKGMVSTALKRAAVHWGIARELYQEGTADLSGEQPSTAPRQQSAPEPSELDEHFGPKQPRSTNNVTPENVLLTTSSWGPMSRRLVAAGLATHDNHAFNRLAKIVHEEIGKGNAIDLAATAKWTEAAVIAKFNARIAKKANES